MANAKYIVIEGASGPQKAAVIRRLAAELQAAQIPVQVFPGYDAYNDLTVQTLYHLTEDSRYPKNNQAKSLVQNATDAQSLESIRAALESGSTCVVDRSYIGTLVEQYYGAGIMTDYALLNEVVQLSSGTLFPDLTVVLDVPVGALQGQEGDTELDEAYLERVRAGYLWEAKQRNLPVIHVDGDAEAIFPEVWNHVTATLAVQATSNPPAAAQSVREVLAAHPPVRAANTAPPFVGLSDNSTDATRETADTALGSSTPIQTSLLLFARLSAARLSQQSINWAELSRKDSTGHYRFYIPASLKGKVRTHYIKTMNQLFDAHVKLSNELLEHIRTASDAPNKARNASWQVSTEQAAYAATRHLLPLAAQAETTLTLTGQTAGATAVASLGDPVAELHTFKESFSNTDIETTHAPAVEKLAHELLASNHAADPEPITLAAYAPHNELDIVPAILYEYSDLSSHALGNEAAKLPYQRKVDVLRAYVPKRTHHPLGQAFARIRYNFDVVNDLAAFHDIFGMFAPEALTWQTATPRMGYATPTVIEAAGLSDAYDASFDLSLQLYSELQSSEHTREAQYAVLCGHKLRANFTLDAQALHQFITNNPMHPFADALYEQIAAVHPLIAELLQPRKLDGAKTGE